MSLISRSTNPSGRRSERAFVIEQPAIPAETIESVLRGAYSISAARVEFLPLGLDPSAWSYRVESDGRFYYLKIRSGHFKPIGPLMPAFLASSGVDQVIPPVPTADGRVWASQEDLHFVLYPFIEGRRASEAGMTTAHWQQLASFLQRLHHLQLPPELRDHVARDTFSPAHLGWVKRFHAGLRTFRGGDALQREMGGLWREQQAALSRLIERTEALSERMHGAGLEFVLCHADIHTANMLIDQSGHLLVVDWDETILAPKERDLTYVLAEIGPADLDAFIECYGEARIDPLAVAYYRHLWCLEDIGVDTENVLSPEGMGEADRSNSLDWLKRHFAAGGEAERALETPLAM